MKKYFTRTTGKWAATLGLLGVCGGLSMAIFAKETISPPKVMVSDKQIDRSGRIGASFAPVVKKVAPSVVNIYSTRTIKMQRFLNPFDFFGEDSDPRSDRPRTRKAQGLGSGVIVSEDGYILTNNHVVEDADKDGVKVALPNDKNEYLAKVVGTDPQTDLAVLKIEAKKLSPVVLGDSDHVEVGDLVLAVGNPFGVGQSVTMGMISALGRGVGILGEGGYEDFIQTDAPINPGNSGGALVDVEGRLLGINQSIVSGSGASAGVGFAVPINLARSIMDRLVMEGKVTRGFLGVNIQPVTPDLAEAFKLSTDSGALVGSVQSDTPAAKAGLKEGDVIVEFNGKKVSDSRHLRLMVAQTAPNTKVTLKLLRDSKEKTLSATLGKLPEELSSRNGRDESLRNEPNAESLEGAEVADLDARTRRQHNIPRDVQGVLVTRVEPDSAEDKAGIKAGDVIVEIDRKPVRTAEDAVALSKKFEDKRMLVRIWSSEGIGGMHYVSVDNRKKK